MATTTDQQEPLSNEALKAIVVGRRTDLIAKLTDQEKARLKTIASKMQKVERLKAEAKSRPQERGISGPSLDVPGEPLLRAVGRAVAPGALSPEGLEISEKFIQGAGEIVDTTRKLIADEAKRDIAAGPLAAAVRGKRALEAGKTRFGKIIFDAALKEVKKQKAKRISKEARPEGTPTPEVLAILNSARPRKGQPRLTEGNEFFDPSTHHEFSAERAEKSRQQREDSARRLQSAVNFARGESDEVMVVNTVLKEIGREFLKSTAESVTRPELMLAEGREVELALNMLDIVPAAGAITRAARTGVKTVREVKKGKEAAENIAAARKLVGELQQDLKAAAKSVEEITPALEKAVKTGSDGTATSVVQGLRNGARALARTAEDYRAIGETEQARKIAAQAENLEQKAQAMAGKAKITMPEKVPESTAMTPLEQAARSANPNIVRTQAPKGTQAVRKIDKDTEAFLARAKAARERSARKPPTPNLKRTLGLIDDEAGFANAQLIATLGGSAVGGEIGRRIAEEEGLPPAVGFAAGALSVASLPILHKVGTVAISKGPKVIQRLTSGDTSYAAEIIRAMEAIGVPDKIIDPAAKFRLVRSAPQAAGALLGAGTGALAFRNEDGSAIALGALGGAATGFVGGTVLGRELGESTLKSGRGFNPLRAAKRLLLEEGTLAPEHAAAKERFTRHENALLRRMRDAGKDIRKANTAERSAVEAYLSDQAHIRALPEHLRESALDWKHGWQELSLGMHEVGDGLEAAEIATELGRYDPKMMALLHGNDDYERVARYLVDRGGGKTLTPKIIKELRGENTPEDVLDSLAQIEKDFNLGSSQAVDNFNGLASELTKRRWANYVRSHPELSRSADEIESAGDIIRKPIKGPSGRLEAQTESQTFVQVPDTAEYGSLAGRYVDLDIADDFMTLVDSSKTLARVMQKAASFEKTAVRAFKRAKVPWNPATQIRNVIGAFTMTNVAGEVPVFSTTWLEAIGDIRKKSAFFKEARDAGMFGRTFIRSELMDDMHKVFSRKGGNPLTKMLTFMDEIGDKVVSGLHKSEDIFEAVEEWNKMVLYRHARQAKGMEIDDAVKFALKNGFDYSSINQFTKWSKSSIFGSPFVTFSVKAIPRAIEAATALQNPKKMFGFWKYPMLTAAANEFAAHQLGVLDDQDLDTSILGTIKRVGLNGLGMPLGIKSLGGDNIYQRFMPDYFGSSMLMLPFPGEYGVMMPIDTTYYTGWGDIGEVGEGPFGKQLASMGLSGLPPFLEPSNPILQTGIAAITGRNTLTGQKIGTAPTKLGRLSQHIVYAGGTWVPSWMPVAGRGFNRMVQAGKKDIPGKETFTQSALSVLGGVTVKSFDPSKGAEQKLGRLKSELKDLRANKNRASRARASVKEIDEFNQAIKEKEEEIDLIEKAAKKIPKNRVLENAKRAADLEQKSRERAARRLTGG